MKMRIDRAAKLSRLAIRSLVVFVVTILVIAFWIITDMKALHAMVNPYETISIRVGRPEFILVLILLLLNVMMSYMVFRHFSSSSSSLRMSLGTIIASLLALCVWIGFRFLPSGVTSSDSQMNVFGFSGVEVALALILVVASVGGAMALISRFRKAQPYLVMSAYSKKVRYKGEWISIEEYLQKELGIEVSHGITPEERDEVMAEFRKELKRKSEGTGTASDDSGGGRECFGHKHVEPNI